MLPFSALAQQRPSCCTVAKNKGQEAFNKKDYDTAISYWTKGKECTDAASKCADLDSLIQKAKTAKQRQAEQDRQRKAVAAAERKRQPAEQPRERKAAEAVNPATAVKAQPPDSSLLTPLQKLEANMVPVAGGSFIMGCQSGRDNDCDEREKPPHEVHVPDFSIGRYEVTQAQWRAVMSSDPPELHNKGCDECPVEKVSWHDIQVFIKKLNSLTGKRYRLPTEAEWEYAARGGKPITGYIYLYSGNNVLDEIAWYDANYSKGNIFGEQKTTRPVGTRNPNELQLYDMNGNVWEWCEDDWHRDYNDAPTDGSAWISNPRGSKRVFRGGSWFNSAGNCRLALRGHNTPAHRFYHLGFRLAL